LTQLSSDDVPVDPAHVKMTYKDSENEFLGNMSPTMCGRFDSDPQLAINDMYRDYT